VLYSIEELREYAESESSLLETLKLWLATTQQSTDLRDGGHIDSIPDLDFVYAELNKILRSFIEKGERAQFLHRDVSEFWQRQVAKLRKVLFARDEEIKKLQDALQAFQANRLRKQNKRGSTTSVVDNERQALVDQVSTQMRAIQEQRLQIDRLKDALNSSEGQRAMASAIFSAGPNQSSGQPHGVQSDVRFEVETKLSGLSQRLAELMKELEETKGLLKGEREENSSLAKRVAEGELHIRELDARLQKSLQQLLLER
jgi:chromosome segregation ATPase